MGYLALYRKYRPVDFNSVYGQEEVVTVIKNAIVSGIGVAVSPTSFAVSKYSSTLRQFP